MRSNETNIPGPVRDVLRGATISGNALTLNGELSRQLYTSTNEVLERLGGKWSKREKAHLFADADELAQIIEEAVETGIVPPKNPFAFFPTPEKVVVDYMIPFLREYKDSSDDVAGLNFLEPSAGDGAIVRVLQFCGATEILAFEIDPARAQKLRELTPYVRETDFLAAPLPSQRGLKVQIDRVAMNPPFSVPGERNVYVRHILKAYDWLVPGGRLVAIAPSNLTFSAEHKVAHLRQFISERGGITPLPPSSFAPHTDVSTVMVRMEKPK